MVCCKIIFTHAIVILHEQETLQHQMDTLHQQNKDAVAAFKKQVGK